MLLRPLLLAAVSLALAGASVAIAADEPTDVIIVSGQTKSGVLDPSTDTDSYAFSGVAGQRVTVALHATTAGLDTRLVLRAPDGTVVNDPAADDDAGPGTDARISARQLAVTGRYRLIASSRSAASAGSYTIRLVVENAAAGQLTLPFARGTAWYVCRGYNVASHRHSDTFDTYYGLDLTVVPPPHGTTGCRGDRNASAGRVVVAPAAGVLRLRGNDRLCLTKDGGGSIYIAHLVSRVSGRVAAGAVIGKVRAAADDAGNYAHIHVHAHRTADCSGPTTPFRTAYGLGFRDAQDLPDKGGVNQYGGASPVRLLRP